MNQSKNLQIEEHTTTAGKDIFLRDGSFLLKARVELAEPHVAIFSELYGRPLNQQTVCDPALLHAESFLRQKNFTFFYADLGADDLVEYPSPPALAVLPRLDENMFLRLEFDRYDGPISGLVEQKGAQPGLFWFNWCTDSGHGGSGRVYSLRPLPKEQHESVRKSVQRIDELDAERLVLQNSKKIPISDRQRNLLRTAEQIDLELDQIHEALPTESWRSLLITAWMPECMEELAAIRVVWVSHEDSARRESWETNVAQALVREDQSELDQLFKNPGVPVTENEIFLLELENSRELARRVVRDWRGQLLGESFWLTPLHQINDLTWRLPKS